MRIAFVSHSSGIAGAERALLDLLPTLSRHHIEPLVILPDNGALQLKLETRGIENLVVPFTWWVSPSWLPAADERRSLAVHERQAEVLAATLGTRQLDAMYSNTSVICTGALAAQYLDLPHLWHLHELNPYPLDPQEIPGQRPHLSFDLGLDRALGLIDELSECCLMTSRAMARAYRPHISAAKTRILYQAVTLNRPSGEANDHRLMPPQRAEGTFRLVIIGSFLEWKRQEDAIRAIGKLVARGDRVELLILGNGGDPEYRQFLERLVSRLGVEQNVWFLHSADPIRLIASADCVVNCSRQEAFGRVTVEGMLLGKPIIGAASGATPELVSDGRTGYLYSPLDHQALAERVRALLQNPARCARMGKRGRRKARRLYSEKRYARRMARILTSMIARWSSVRWSLVL